jgi:hypothetical protein
MSNLFAELNGFRRGTFIRPHEVGVILELTDAIPEGPFQGKPGIPMITQ